MKSVAGFCEHDNESWGLMKGGEFLDQLSDYLVLHHVITDCMELKSTRLESLPMVLTFIPNVKPINLLKL
jgi:hypothetical protein